MSLTNMAAIIWMEISNLRINERSVTCFSLYLLISVLLFCTKSPSEIDINKTICSLLSIINLVLLQGGGVITAKNMFHVLRTNKSVLINKNLHHLSIVI